MPIAFIIKVLGKNSAGIFLLTKMRLVSFSNKINCSFNTDFLNRLYLPELLAVGGSRSNHSGLRRRKLDGRHKRQRRACVHCDTRACCHSHLAGFSCLGTHCGTQKITYTKGRGITRFFFYFAEFRVSVGIVFHPAQTLSLTLNAYYSECDWPFHISLPLF